MLWLSNRPILNRSHTVAKERAIFYSQAAPCYCYPMLIHAAHVVAHRTTESASRPLPCAALCPLVHSRHYLAPAPLPNLLSSPALFSSAQHGSTSRSNYLKHAVLRIVHISPTQLAIASVLTIAHPMAPALATLAFFRSPTMLLSRIPNTNPTVAFNARPCDSGEPGPQHYNLCLKCDPTWQSPLTPSSVVAGRVLAGHARQAAASGF
ncbi:hypothetical protein IG631_01966 [Alternaria alternata]|nr:hypothetical protein IG631_01966 [Alternaria alternata]